MASLSSYGVHDLGTVARQIIQTHCQANSVTNVSSYCLYYHNIKLSYTYIPKNACTTLKRSLGVADETMPEDVNPHGLEINYITHSLCPHLMVKKIIALRDPFKRIVSAYLDKITEDEEFEPFAADACIEMFRAGGMDDDTIRRSLQIGVRPTFSEFVTFLAGRPDVALDKHWRSQCSFFTFQNYDKIFAVETLEEEWLKSDLSHIPLLIYPSHRTSRGRRIVALEEDLGISTPVPHTRGDLLHRLMKEKDIVPSTSLFFGSEQILQLFIRRFADDLIVYKSLFPCLLEFKPLFPVSHNTQSAMLDYLLS